MLQEITDKYLKRIINAKSRIELQKIWETLINELKTTKPTETGFRKNRVNETITASTIKRYISELRKHISNNCKSKIETNKYRINTNKSDKQDNLLLRRPVTLPEKRLFWSLGEKFDFNSRAFVHCSPLAVCIAPYEIRQEKAKTTTVNLKERETNKIKINEAQILPVVKKLLNTLEWNKLVLGLCLATGRRSIEILKTAKFKEIKGCTDFVMFEGQAKTKEKIKYKIPLIGIEAKKLILKIEFLRKNKDFSKLDNVQVHDKTVISLNRALNTHKLEKPNTTFFPAKLLSANDLHVHSLRGIYAIHCIHKYSNIDNATAYLQSILGHQDKNVGDNYRIYELI